MDRLSSSGVARQAGVNLQTLRYYERRGLLPRPARTRSNYRLYPEDTVQRLRFIRRAQGVGFSLEEIRRLLSARVRPGVRCEEISKLAEAKIRDLDVKLRDLSAMRRALGKLVSACAGKGPATGCLILKSLDSGGART